MNPSFKDTTGSKTENPRIGILQRIKNRIRDSDKGQPIFTRLLENPIEAIVFAFGLLIATSGAIFSDSVSTELREFGILTPRSLIITALLVGAFINLAVLPLCTSYISLFSTHTILLLIALLFLFLTITESPILTAAMAILFAVLGYDRGANGTDHKMTVWDLARLTLAVILTFISAGHYLFNYSNWIYAISFSGYSILGIKDTVTAIIFALILITACAQTFGWLYSYYVSKPNATELPILCKPFEKLRLKLSRISKFSAITFTNPKAPLIIRLFLSGKKALQLLISMFLVLLQVLIIATIFLVSVISFALSFLHLRNLKNTFLGLSPVIFIVSITSISLLLGNLLSQSSVDLSSNATTHAALLKLFAFGFLMSILFSALNFKHFPSQEPDGAENQILEQISVSTILWMFFLVVSSSFCHWIAGNYTGSFSSICLIWFTVFFVIFGTAILFLKFRQKTPEQAPPAYEAIAKRSGGIFSAFLGVMGLLIVTSFSILAWSNMLVFIFMAFLVVLVSVLVASFSRQPIKLSAIAIAILSCLIALTNLAFAFPIPFLSSARSWWAEQFNFGVVNSEPVRSFFGRATRSAISDLKSDLKPLSGWILEDSPGGVLRTEGAPGIPEKSTAAKPNGGPNTGLPEVIIGKGMKESPSTSAPVELGSETRNLDLSDLSRIIDPASGQPVYLTKLSDSELASMNLYKVYILIKVVDIFSIEESTQVGLLPLAEFSDSNFNDRVSFSNRKIRRIPQSENWKLLASRIAAVNPEYRKDTFCLVVYFDSSTPTQEPIGFTKSLVSIPDAEADGGLVVTRFLILRDLQ